MRLLPKRSDVGDWLFLAKVSRQRVGVIFSSSDDEDGKTISFPDGDEGFLHATQGGQEVTVFPSFSSSSSDDEDHKWRFGNDRRHGSSALLRFAIIRVDATIESFATLDERNTRREEYVLA